MLQGSVTRSGESTIYPVPHTWAHMPDTDWRGGKVCHITNADIMANFVPPCPPIMDGYGIFWIQSHNIWIMGQMCFYCTTQEIQRIIFGRQKCFFFYRNKYLRVIKQCCLMLLCLSFIINSGKKTPKKMYKFYLAVMAKMCFLWHLSCSRFYLRYDRYSSSLLWAVKLSQQMQKESWRKAKNVNLSHSRVKKRNQECLGHQL